MALYTTTQCVRPNLNNINQKHPKVLSPKFPNQFVALLRKGFTEKKKVLIKKFRKFFLQNQLFGK